MKTILVITITLFLLGCSAQTASVAPAVKPQLGAIDSALTADCNNPVVLPEKLLSQFEVEKHWSTDRKSLVECKRRHKGLKNAIEFRDRHVTGK